MQLTAVASLVRTLSGMPRRTRFRSLSLSYRHSRGSLLELPIVAGPESVIGRPVGARLDLGGQLFLGYSPDRVEEAVVGSLPALGAAVIGLWPRATLATRGWVILGPGTHVTIGPEASLVLGEGAYFAGDTRVYCNERIEIGADCAISWDVLIMDHDAHTITTSGHGRPNRAPISIGHHVWVGAKATVLKGVHIGNGAIVAASSVVTSDVPAHCLVAGSPARVLRQDVEWS